MAITFPRTWSDDFKIVGLSFYQAPMLETVRTRSGGAAAISMGTTLWRGRFESPPLSEADFGTFRAWVDTLIEGETFYGYDILRKYPLNYPTGFAEFTDSPQFEGTCQLVNVTDSKIVTIGNVPDGLILAAGDYIAFDYGTDNKRALHRVVEGGTAGGSPIEIDVEVRPFVRTGWDDSPLSEVYIYKPSAEMHLVPGTVQESVGVDRLGTISFEAEQRL